MARDDAYVERYSRQLILAEIGPRGQERLAAARVAIPARGAAAEHVIAYLAAAGVGTLAIAPEQRALVDPDQPGIQVKTLPRHERDDARVGFDAVLVDADAAGGLGATQFGSSLVPTSSPFAAYLLPLWALATAAVLGVSVAFTTGVARGGGDYRRWMALASPAALVVATGACASLFTSLHALLVPASPNLAHVVFFALAASDVTQRRSAGTPDALRRVSSSPSR